MASWFASRKVESEDAEALLPDEPVVVVKSQTRKRILLVASHLACVVGGLWAGRAFVNRDVLCMSFTSRYSPLLDADISYSTVKFNGSFTKLNDFRLDAGPKVDAAWESLGVDYRAVAIPAHLALKSGLAPDQVKIRDKYGGGYPANVEGLHHLHCLNLLRKSLYFNHAYYHDRGEGAFKNEEHIVKFHVTHCLDIIRQQLMCTVDVGVLGQVWWNPKAPEPFVDFNTRHECRDFEAVRSWAEVRQLPEEPPHDYLQPPRDDDRVYESIP
ncbi:hypothetical protein EJ06DRAFT_584040 [Trichodelitschia bisporula]|uniref:Tat pathway signal sequence n=1 Tax=Trichodelitschia bisporula TaxID=703511 RepID=A0A6G1HNI0_9PEZI|nr:hypothetical protein EJ06DRAFT_584040 [Trichodelitschia bisporula]